MIAEGIQKIIDIAKNPLHTIHGLQYTEGPLTLVPPPSAAAFSVDTLDGFVNMLEAGIDNFEPKNTVIHILSFKSVQLVQCRATEYGKRIAHVEAKPTEGITQFPFFNQPGPQEDFVIGLQTHFQPMPESEFKAGQKVDDLVYLMDLASHITFAEKAKQVDTGVRQEITLQRGIAHKEDVEVRARLTLKPYRTFRELSQPASDFIFRIKDGPKLALYEADGGTWKIAAIAAIQEWLTNRIQTSEIATLREIPIIS